jgi:hypothetical protein
VGLPVVQDLLRCYRGDQSDRVRRVDAGSDECPSLSPVAISTGHGHGVGERVR